MCVIRQHSHCLLDDGIVLLLNATCGSVLRVGSMLIKQVRKPIAQHACVSSFAVNTDKVVGIWKEEKVLQHE